MRKVICCLFLTLLFQLSNLPSTVFATDILIDTTDTDLIVSDEYVVTNIMPGDIFTKKLIWENNSTKTQKLYIYVDDVSNKKLNEALRLKIATKDETILDCKLAEVTESSKFLGEFSPTTVEEIGLHLYFDQYADNQYTMLDTEFSVYFLTSEKVKTPDSGDTTNLTMWVSLACVCVGALYIMWKEGKHEKIN